MFLDVRDLTITLKTGEEIAEDISFSIDGGEMLSIVGSSGAGKTTVCKAVMGLLRTVIVIAHRMRTIANADKIVVLDKGKVTEVGTPSELAKKGGLYAHLVALQQKQQMSSLPT